MQINNILFLSIERYFFNPYKIILYLSTNQILLLKLCAKVLITNKK